MNKEELMEYILSNYDKKDILFIKKSLSDSLEKEKIIIEIRDSCGSLQKEMCFYYLNEAEELFDNLMKDAIRRQDACSLRAYGKGWTKGNVFNLQILNHGDRGKVFSINHNNQDWIYMTLKEIEKSDYNLENMEKNKHLFLDDAGKFPWWVLAQ